MTDFGKILFGAFLAIFGGVIGKITSVYIDEWRERKYIKTSLSDELGEIISIIDKFKETYDSTTQLMPTYLVQLKTNTESYDLYKPRLYLMIRSKNRFTIINFYRKLKKCIDDNEGKLGSLSAAAKKGKTEDQNQIITRFTELQTEASKLKGRLTNFWIIF